MPQPIRWGVFFRMFKALKRASTYVVFLVFAVLSIRLISRTPTLVYWIGELDCACGDWHEKITRSVVWNPFRDQAPELAAETFLIGLQNNQCHAPEELCRAALANKRPANWELRFRENEGQTSHMYFALTRIGRNENVRELSGQAVVTARFQEGLWQIIEYDTIF
jgi:hypothetical protein